MKIVVTTIGSRGDVQPYVNLCQGLQALRAEPDGVLEAVRLIETAQ